MEPLVSILIPAFNSEAWIANTLRSASAQTWERKEIILVDDGSTDGTLSIARQFESDSIRVVTQKNQGAAAARNTAFSLSQGDYIQWLDADDLLSPDKIASQMRVALTLSDPRMLLSCGWGRFMYSTDRSTFSPSPLWCDLDRAEWLMRKMENNAFMADSTWLVSRSVTAAAGPWNTQLLVDDDGEYFCRVLLASDGVKFVQGPKVYYRSGGYASVSKIGLSLPKMASQWQSMELHLKYLKSLDDSPRSRAARLTYLQNWLHYFYPERMDLVNNVERAATDLGGTLQTPTVSWKYAWIDALCGRRAAKHTQLAASRLRWDATRLFERLLTSVTGAK